MKRDGSAITCWQQELSYISKQPTSNASTTDVVIIGGGITGLATANRLLSAGIHCIVVEAYNIGFGTTGGTTAHINSVLETPYFEIEKKFSEDVARSLANITVLTIDEIKENCKTFINQADFSTRDAFLMATNRKQSDTLKKYLEDGIKYHLPILPEEEFIFPRAVKTIRLKEQASFHPIKYVHGLANLILSKGGAILENCSFLECEETETEVLIKTSTGVIKAAYCFYATHIPPGITPLNLLCAPYRSYAIAAVASSKLPDYLLYDLEDPYHYVRPAVINNRDMLIIGGGDHKTGHDANPAEIYEELEKFARTYFDIEPVLFKWSSQYFEPADGLPYIGELPGSDRQLVATGFGGNGMIYSHIAAQIIECYVRKNYHPLQQAFKPTRVKPVASFKNFVEENTDVLKEFIVGKLDHRKLENLDKLPPGIAEIIRYEGKDLAIYRDYSGFFHAIHSSCSHMGCKISFNKAETTWDCPCHGSRFSIYGEVLTGPSTAALQPILFEDPIQQPLNRL